MRFKEIPFEKIEVGDDRLRTVDQNWVEVLCGSIEEFGLKQPIEVREIDGGYRLVAGAHRLAAYAAMDEIKNDEEAESDEYKVIPAIVLTAKTDHEAAEFRVHEITENIVRRDLNVLHRSAHLAELKEAYEELHPETKHGGSRKEKNQVAKIATRFSEEAATKTGLSERSIQLAVKIHNGIEPILREKIDGTWLANHQAGLLQLTEVGPKERRMVCDILFAENPSATTVSDALAIVWKKPTLSHIERKYASINKALEGLKESELDNVFVANEAKIMAWLDRTGKR